MAYVAAAAAPERFKSLTVMAVPYAGRFAREGLRILKQLRLSWYMGFFNIYWLSDWVVQRQTMRLSALWRDWSPGCNRSGHAERRDKDLVATRCALGCIGYYRAALSIKALLVSAEEAHYAVPVPTLAMSGERDGCIACDVFERLTVADDFPQGVTFHRVSGGDIYTRESQRS